MSIGGLMLQNPRWFAWLIIASAMISGMLIMSIIMVIFRNRLFERWISRGLKDKNDTLRVRMARLINQNKDLEDENARLRGNWGQAVVKASQGVAVVLSAFGIDSTGGSDERD